MPSLLQRVFYSAFSAQSKTAKIFIIIILIITSTAFMIIIYITAFLIIGSLSIFKVGYIPDDKNLWKKIRLLESKKNLKSEEIKKLKKMKNKYYGMSEDMFTF